MKNLAKPTEPLHQPGQWHLPAACLLAGGLLDGLTSMNLGWAWPVWLAPVFYLRTMDYLGRKKGFWAIVFTSFTSGVTSAALTLPSLFADIIVMMLTMTLVSSGVYWLYHTLYANITGFKATLLFPALGTFLDYLLSWVHPFGSIASGAYLQHGLLPLIQLSSLTGIWGITFLVGWFGAVCHFIWKEGHYHSVRTVVAKAWPFWSAMLGVFCYGLLRLYMPAAEHSTIVAAGVTAPRQDWLAAIQTSLQASDAARPQEIRSLQDRSHRLYQRLEQATLKAHRQGARLVVWQEAAVPVRESALSQLTSKLSGLASQAKVYLAATAWVIADKQTDPATRQTGRNRLFFYAPSGELLFSYDKHILVPGPEAAVGIPGAGVVPVVNTSFGKVSGVICYDADFPHYVKKAGRQQAELLIVPGADSEEITPFHTRQAYFRAVENGCSLIRVATGGLSGIVDPYGRRIAEVNDHSFTQGSFLLATIPVYRVPTLYPLLGDWVAWGSGLLAMVLLGYAKFRRQKTSKKRIASL